MLLLVFARLRVLVAEDEMDLVSAAALVWAKHDDVRRGIGELVGLESRIVLQQLHVGTTALEESLEFDLILHHERLALVVDGLGEFGRNGVMSGFVLEHETLVAGHSFENGWLFDVPGSDVLPFFLGVFLFGMGSLPPIGPAFSELLEERCFEICGLGRGDDPTSASGRKRNKPLAAMHTVNLGKAASETAVLVSSSSCAAQPIA